jgi:heme oxygenase
MGAHPRPAGPDDALSTLLREQTADIHRAAERRPFMVAFFRGQLPRDAYVDWLARQRHLYATLELALDAIPEESPARGLVPAALYRTGRIEADLDHLTDRSWRDHDRRTPATAAYVDRIERVAGFPPGLIAHAWLRYLGNVGGRDVLRRLAATSTGTDPDDDRGLAFTDFSAVGDEVGPFFRSFHARLDTLPLDRDDTARVVAEGRTGFELNIALTDELAADHGLDRAAEGGGSRASSRPGRRQGRSSWSATSRRRA